ncbi:MAG: apolipoprotein N-acyltransferase [Oscillatoria sp. SIO1A7]|nr:apolipoprotein N-acyltransferase [Oscillatoria sp. SIO1A7]
MQKIDRLLGGFKGAVGFGQIAAAIAGGLLMGLAPAPLNLWPLAWIALVPLWVELALGCRVSGVGCRERERGKGGERGEMGEIEIHLPPTPPTPYTLHPTPLKRAILGLAWGIGYHGLALFWITGIHPMTWMGVPWLASLAIALFCWLFITLWGAVLVAIWALGIGNWELGIGHWALGAGETPALRVPGSPASQVPNNPKLGEASRYEIVSEEQKFSQGCYRPYKTQNSKLEANNSKLEANNSKLSISLSRVLIATALWCVLEAIWSVGPLWWSSLSYTQSPHNPVILHLSQLSGPSAVTAAIVAVNGLIAEAWIAWQNSRAKLASNSPDISQALEKSTGYANPELNQKASQANLSQAPFTLLLLALVLFSGSHLLGFALYSRPLSELPENQLKIGIVQGNIPNKIKLDPEGWSRALAGYARGYRQLASQGVDAVLTPETALPYLWTVESRRSSLFYQGILEKKVVAWVGSFGTKGGSFTNSLFTVTGDGETFSRYDKANLVPLGEYIPFENILGGSIDRLSPLDAHLVAGAKDQVFDTPFGRAIAGICFDSPFAEHFRYQAAAGGQFILTAANDAHYSSDMLAQHHALDLMRAIESDRWVARATNTGLSAVIDPHGKTRWISGINTYELYAGNIYRRESKTLYVRWGDRLTPLLFFLGLLVWFFQRNNE